MKKALTPLFNLIPVTKSNLRQILNHAFVLLLLLLSVTLHSQKPNIIYIMTDDMGYADLSGYGRKDYATPNIDRLASQGMKFVNAYSAGALCTPTRVALMTGRYPAKIPLGLKEPLLPTKKDSAFGLTTEYPFIATLVKKEGYETALIGKWHLGFLPVHSPVKNGFNYFFGMKSGAADYISHKGHDRHHDLFENDSLVYPAGYLTDIFTDKAVEYLRKKHEAPFFLAVTYNAPHWPWQGPGDKAYEDTADFKKGGSPAIYAAMMKSLDDGVGRILQEIEAQGLSKNTVVIFTNDNGGERYSDNGGLSNSKGTLWEGGIRVPAIVRWPGKIKARKETKQSAITMDWTATILSLAGGNPAPGFEMDGIDLLPVLKGKKKNIERSFYWRTFQRTQHKAIRQGDWKYLKVEKGEYLFNLAHDPGEKVDLKLKNVAEFNKLKQLHERWEKTVLTPIPL